MNILSVYEPYEDEINKHYYMIDVTQGGIDYILECLRFGRTLSNLIARNILIENGKVETIANRSVDVKRYFKFKAGYINQDLPESLKNLQIDDSDWVVHPVDNFFVVHIIQEFLAKSKRNICIFEDIDSSPNDPWLTKTKLPPIFTFADTDAYFFMEDENPTIATIRNTIDIACASWSARIFLTSIPTSVEKPKTNQAIDMKNLIELAKSTEKIIVSAYDGESYLLWHRSEKL